MVEEIGVIRSRMTIVVRKTGTVEYGASAVLPLYNFCFGQLSHGYSSAAND